MNRLLSLSMISFAVFIFTGCTIGPDMLRVSRMQYNQAIQRTTDEQLLLNLVRLKYRDAPLFVEVGSVSAQFQFDHSFGVSTQFNEDVGIRPAGTIRADSRIGFVDRPTITFSPLQGDEFAKRLLSPLSLDTMVLLIRSGWSVDRVLRLCVQQMNALDNASRASGPTPESIPVFTEFSKASRLFRRLQVDGMLEVGRSQIRNVLSPPIEANALGASDLIAAAREGFRFEQTDHRFVLTGSPVAIVVRMAKEVVNTRAGQRLISLLDLKWSDTDQDVTTYPLTIGSIQKAISKVNKGSQTQIVIMPRSLMGVLFYLCHAIEVPAIHREKGLVTVTRDTEGVAFDWTEVTGDLLKIHSQRARPEQASISIQYRNHWFYIDDTDLQSKTTFSLLVQLFALQAGSADGVAPVLTLPVG